MPKPHLEETNIHLLARVRNPNDEHAWSEFFGLYSKVIRSQALRRGLGEDETGEVVQDTFIEVSRRMATFEYDRSKGSFRSWLFQLASWRIVNQLKRRNQRNISLDSLIGEEDAEETPEEDIRLQTDDLEQSWTEEWKQAVFHESMEKLRHRIPPKHFQVLDCLIVKHWRVPTVCRRLGMNRASFYVVKFRALKALKREVERLSRDRF